MFNSLKKRMCNSQSVSSKQDNHMLTTACLGVPITFIYGKGSDRESGIS